MSLKFKNKKSAISFYKKTTKDEENLLNILNNGVSFLDYCQDDISLNVLFFPQDIVCLHKILNHN